MGKCCYPPSFWVITFNKKTFLWEDKFNLFSNFVATIKNRVPAISGAIKNRGPAISGAIKNGGPAISGHKE